MAAQTVCAQTNKEKALAKTEDAIKLMDDGQIKESIKLLEEAIKLDPTSATYPYEMAYAYYSEEDYKSAIKTLEKIENYSDVTDQTFQLLGNSYDYLEKSDKAVAAYKKGLEKFPKSGRLYLELGTLNANKQDYSTAAYYYEKGIQVEPAFPSNYYNACKIYCLSTEKVWTMLYGEIFMNLERNTKRTEEISKLLFNTYKKQIKLTSDSSLSVSFSKSSTINIGDLNDSGKLKMPFGVMVYEPTLMMSMLFVKKIDINSLDSIRSKFVDNYYARKFDKTYPNVLFAYQKKVKDAGFMDAYNHWILMKGDEDNFIIWQNKNKTKWDDFVTWFTENTLKLTDTNKFYREQY